MDLIPVRHALPEPGAVETGAADAGLTPVGHRHAELLAEYLPTAGIDAIPTHRAAASRSGVRSAVTVNGTSHLPNSGLPMGTFQKG